MNSIKGTPAYDKKISIRDFSYDRLIALSRLHYLV